MFLEEYDGGACGTLSRCSSARLSLMRLRFAPLVAGRREAGLSGGISGRGGCGQGFREGVGRSLLLFLIWNIRSSVSGFSSWFQRSSFPIIPNAAALI